MAGRKRTKAQGTRADNSITSAETSRNMPASVPAERNHREAAPTVDEIRRRAYELFEARGGNHGNDLADWLTAERELMGVSRVSA